jgi:predicted CoA-binding protein
MVDIFRTPDAALGITREAIAIDAKIIWMQLGVRHSLAAEIAEAAGLRVVMDRCPKIELEKYSLD